MGARRSGSPASTTTAAAVESAKKKKSSPAPAASHGSFGSTASLEASLLAATQATGTVRKIGKREGKKKRPKPDSCLAQSPEAPSSCPAAICSDKGSINEVCGVLSSGKKVEQCWSVCDETDGDHIISVAAADAQTAVAAAAEEVVTERQKKRCKRDATAAVEGRKVTSVKDTSADSSIIGGASNCRGSSGSTLSRRSSIYSDRTDSSDDSSSTCCSSPASSDAPHFAATTEEEKRREGLKEKNDHEGKCFPEITAAAVAAEGRQQQGNQLSTYKLTPQTLAVLQQRGIQQLLPIQAATFSHVYSGKDLIGRADTGTGKTLAFALPLVERLLSSPASSSNSSSNHGSASGRGSEKGGAHLLVLLPTRELAQQVHAELVLLLQGRLETACVYGGGSAAAASRQQHHGWQSTKMSQQGSQLQQQKQLENLRRGRCAVLVGCPGRVKDLINRGYLQRGAALQSVVLDEADRLLDMGFREDVEEILQWCRDAWNQAHSSPAVSDAAEKTKKIEEGELSAEVSAAAGSRNSTDNSSKEALQFLLFTATLPHWAKSLASRFMRPDRLVVDAAALNKGNNTNGASSKADENGGGSSKQQQQQQSGTNQGITYLVLFCPWKNRVRVLEDVLTLYAGPEYARPALPSIASSEVSSVGVACNAAAAGEESDMSNGGKGAGAAAVIFAETKQQVNEIAFESNLRRLAAPLHGDLPQQQRETTLNAFKSGCFPYLVATDVAARGLHVDGLPLVVQLSPPRDLDSFVHRAGRTGRAGKAGTCLTFAATPDIPMLLSLEKKLRMQFKRVGVPQPAGIQKRLLDLQLRYILPPPATASRDTSGSTSLSSCSNTEESSRDNNNKKVRKCLTQGNGKNARNLVETMEQLEEGKTILMESRGERADTIKEEMRQIFDAADRVLHALSPREAVRRCLALILRHAAVGSAGTAFSRSDPSASGMSVSSASAVSGASEAVQTADPPNQGRLSCLNGREGLCTYVLRKREKHHELQKQVHQNGDDLLRTPGEVWRLLKGALLSQRWRPNVGRRCKDSDKSSVSNEVLEQLLERICSLTLTADGRGAVFDVAAEDIPAFEAHVLRRCREKSTRKEAYRDCSIEGAQLRMKDRKNTASEGETSGKEMISEDDNDDDDDDDETGGDDSARDAAATEAAEIPFTIREVEELPELVDALALRRSEQGQGGSRISMQQGRYNDFRYPWKNGNTREGSDRMRGGGHNYYNSDNNNRKWGPSNNRFRSENGYSSSSNSDRGAQQRSESSVPRGRGGSRGRGTGGRGGGGGRGVSTGFNRTSRGSSSNRGRGGYHRGEL